MTPTTLRRTALAILVASASLGALAQSATSATPAAAATAPMSMMQVLERVTAQGFRDVREIELEDDRLYEIKATNDKGQRVKIYIDAHSGEVLKQKIKNKGSRS